MKMIAAFGIAGGLFMFARGWIGLVLVVWIAARVSHGLALAVLKEALRAGWFDEPR